MTSSGVEWTDKSGRHIYSAVGDRDVLIIMSEDVSGPDVMQRRPAIVLTKGWTRRLESQGIPRGHQTDDLNIITARNRLDKTRTITGVEMSSPGGERLTRESVLIKIAYLMRNCSKAGVVLHYIGAGRRNTGDWCFDDGYITFRDLAHLYLQLLRGRVLLIVTDCSHSGSWVRECMTFMDEQGVKPCGHSARDKGILLKVLASCLSHQVPRQLAYSVCACANVNGLFVYHTSWDAIKLASRIADFQHVRGLDFTIVRCGCDLIADRCLCLPQATWQTWNAKNRLFKVSGKDWSKSAYHVVQLEDNDEKMLTFLEKLGGDINVADHGTVLISGWGNDVPDDAWRARLAQYSVYWNESEADCLIEEIEKAFTKNEMIDRKHAQSMLIGPGGSGKTSFMYRMLGKKISCLASTGVADEVVIVDMNPPTYTFPVSMVDHTQWKEGELDIEIVRQMHSSNLSLVLTKDEKLNCLEQHQASPSTYLTDTIPPLVLKPTLQRFFTVKPDVGQMKKAINHAVKNEGGYERFKKSVKRQYSFYMRDAGGQVEFQEMVTLFIFGPALFFFVFRADLDFRMKQTIRYRKSASESINTYTSSISTEEALLQCLASVYAMGTSDEATASVKVHQPFVFIIATHKDMLGPSADQKLADLNEAMISLIKSNGFEDIVLFANRSMHQLMFAVDNTSPSDEDFEVIRLKVQNLISSRQEFTIKYPLRYLLFCLDLKNDPRTTLTLDECRVMAANFGIEGDEVLHLLQFLHLRIGVIQFINIEGVTPVVMKEPQILYDKVTDLTIRTFTADTLRVSEAEDYEKKGILTASVFESVLEKSDFITPQEFLKILVHLRIIAPFRACEDKEERYFIPFVLNHVPESAGNNRETDVAPLAVKFKCKHCPKGLFGVMITHLMTRKEDELPAFHLMEDKIYKDQVSFEVYSYGEHDEITLTNHFSYFEIGFFPEQVPEFEERDTPVKEVCSKVRQVIEVSILSALENLHYSRANVKPVVCVRCSACSELHPVEKGRYYRIHCKKDGRKRAHCIPEEAKSWFNEGPVSAPQPTRQSADHQKSLTEADLSAIKRHLSSLSPEETRAVGNQLGLGFPRLKRMNPESVAEDMVTAWLRKDDYVKETTWHSLIKALQALGHNGIAESILSKQKLIDRGGAR